MESDKSMDDSKSADHVVHSLKNGSGDDEDEGSVGDDNVESGSKDESSDDELKNHAAADEAVKDSIRDESDAESVADDSKSKDTDDESKDEIGEQAVDEPMEVSDEVKNDDAQSESDEERQENKSTKGETLGELEERLSETEEKDELTEHNDEAKEHGRPQDNSTGNKKMDEFEESEDEEDGKASDETWKLQLEPNSPSSNDDENIKDDDDDDKLEVLKEQPESDEEDENKKDDAEASADEGDMEVDDEPSVNKEPEKEAKVHITEKLTEDNDESDAKDDAGTISEDEQDFFGFEGGPDVNDVTTPYQKLIDFCSVQPEDDFSADEEEEGDDDDDDGVPVAQVHVKTELSEFVEEDDLDVVKFVEDDDLDVVTPQPIASPATTPYPDTVHTPVASTSAMNTPGSKSTPSSYSATTRDEGLSSSASSPVSISSAGGRKSDISSFMYRRPLEMGWKRELVYRSTFLGGPNVSRMGDIYYYAPNGKKLRSIREIRSYLEKNDIPLTAEHFTFLNEPLGVNDPDKEIIRSAKKTSFLPKPTTPVQKTPKERKTPKAPKESEQMNGFSGVPEAEPARGTSLDTGASTAAEPAVPPKQRNRLGPKIKITPTRADLQQKRTNLNKEKVQAGTQTDKSGVSQAKDKERDKSKSAESEEMEIGMLPPTWNEDATPSVKKIIRKVSIVVPRKPITPVGMWVGSTMKVPKSAEIFEPCSIRCPGMSGLVPTLQCRMCLCLFHPECVGGSLADETEGYLCMKCQQESKENAVQPLLIPATAPPPLMPVNEIVKAVGRKSPASIFPPGTSKLPKLQKLPQAGGESSRGISGSTNAVPSSQVPGLLPDHPPVTAATTLPAVIPSNGSVTWVPPSPSSFGVKKKMPVPSSSYPLQSVFTLQGKKYIVIEKHSEPPIQGPNMPNVPTSSSQHIPVNQLNGLKVTTCRPIQPRIVNPSTMTTALIGQPQTSKDSSRGSLVQSGQGGIFLVPIGGPNKDTQEPQFLIVNNALQHTVMVNQSGLVKPTQALQVSVPASRLSPSLSGYSGRKDKSMVSPEEPASAVSPDMDDSDNGFDDLGKKRKLSTGEKPCPKRFKKASSDGESEDSFTHHFAEHFMLNLGAGYDALLQIFRYLKVQELLRAARVCRMWRDLAGHQSLWRTVRMKNSIVTDWRGFSLALKRNRTEHLDLRKMIVPGQSEAKMWEMFCQEIGSATYLKKLDLCRCPVDVVEKIPSACPQLEAINATALRCSDISLEPLCKLKQLQELRLRSLNSISLSSPLSSLRDLLNLRHLSLTTFKELGQTGLEVLRYLTSLETLELGECTEFNKDFNNAIPKLCNLQKLRLEKAQGGPTSDLIVAVSTLPKLTHLELINFDVKAGFDEALSSCKQLKKLLIIPSYWAQSATSNQLILRGVMHLKQLTHFVWGITYEILRVTQLFMAGTTDPEEKNKYSGSKAKECIPVMKPLPIVLESGAIDMGTDDKAKPGSKDSRDVMTGDGDTVRVNFVPLQNLYRLLTQSLPSTKVQIQKVPFHATWRETISDQDS